MKSSPVTKLILGLLFLMVPATLSSSPLPQSPPNIQLSGAVTPKTVRKGQTAQGTLVMDIPAGYHVHSNKPLEKFLISTSLKVEGPSGIQIGPSLYPRPLVKSLKFSKNKVAVFERKTTMRFSVTVPANFSSGSVELKARLRYQSCNDDVCFPPQTKEESVWLKVE